jgi:hypothetical protein
MDRRDGMYCDCLGCNPAVDAFEEHKRQCEKCRESEVPQDLCPKGQELY